MTVSRRILVRVALGTGFVVAVVTAVTYALVFSAMKESGVRQLETYVRERAEREEARFRQIESNLRLVRGQFLHRLGRPQTPEEIAAFWDRWYVKCPDGAWRSREGLADSRRNPVLWADNTWPDSPECRRIIATGHQLCAELMPGWLDSFPSCYFQLAGMANIGFDVDVPLWPSLMPGHYETAGLEWIALSLPEHPARDGCRWTGVQNDPAEPTPMVSVYLPVWHGDEFLGSVGHNMYMHRTLDASTQCDIAGAVHFIVREDGRLIAHSRHRQRILDTAGDLTAQATGDAALTSLHAVCLAHPGERRFSGFDGASDSYYSVARLAGPEWLFVTAVPQSQLQAEAFASAQWVLWSGLVSLALVLGFIAWTLRKQVSQPLAELARATDAMTRGDAPGPVLAPRADELGALADSFRSMCARVAGRESDLRELNADLEARVATRTGELAIALAQERELGQLKTNFVSLVSHEFRTPLGVIMAAVEVLRRYFDRLPQEKRQEQLDIIFRSTKNLAALIEEVLLLGRVEDGRLSLDPQPLDLDKLCRTLTDELYSATGGTSPIHYRAGSPLDEAVADESTVRHILTNLISNAVKYSDPGQPVEFTLTRDRADAVFTIRDRGIGIPVEEQTHILESFTRGSNVGNRPGTGLGLVIVQRCVALHAGSMVLQSTPGEGTTVTVRLPLFAHPSPLNSPTL